MKNINVTEPTQVEGSLLIEKYWEDGSTEKCFEEKNLIVLASRQNILASLYSTPLSIYSITGAVNQQATVTTDTAHGLTTGSMVTISGVTPLEYCGTFPIIVTGSTTFNYFSLSAFSQPTGTGSYKYVYPVSTPDPINALQVGIGGSMDSRTISNCSISISTNTLTTVSGSGFLSTDVGQTVTIQGAGPGGSVLNVIVTAYNSASSVTISDSAYTTVSNISVTIGQGLFPNQEDPAATGLVAPVATLSTIYTINATVPSVTYVADVNQSTANGFLLTEAGLIKLSGALFNIKNYPGIPKTSDFGVHYVWTIKYA